MTFVGCGLRLNMFGIEGYQSSCFGIENYMIKETTLLFTYFSYLYVLRSTVAYGFSLKIRAFRLQLKVK